MNKVAIIGASVSGHNIALRLKGKRPDCEVTLLSDENYPPYDHLKLADLISGVISESDLFFCSEDFYLKQNINFLKGKKVATLNTQKKLIYFKDKGSLNYDFLVIASGRSPSLPEIPGARKEGVFRLYTLDDTKEFLKRYISEPVAVAGSNAFTLRVSEAISERFKSEVKLITHKVFDPGLVPKNVEVVQDSIKEIIGEGQAQAVKLASGKALSISAVLFVGDYKSNIDFLKNTDVRVKDDFVVIDAWMQSTVKDIFACGNVVAKDSVVVSMMLVDNIIHEMKGEICQRS